MTRRHVDGAGEARMSNRVNAAHAWCLASMTMIAFALTPGCTQPPPECTTDSDCADPNPCTDDSCVASECVHAPVTGCTCTADSQCDDGDLCTADVCEATGCTHLPTDGPDCSCELDADCDDGDVCTTETCDGSFCSYLPSGLPECVCSTDVDCDDGDACTTDACQGDGSCQSTPIVSPACPGTADREAVIFVGSIATCSDVDTCGAAESIGLNVLVADEALDAQCSQVGDARVCPSVSAYTSERGPDELTISTSVLSSTATYDASTQRYVIGGTTGTAAFGASTDALEVVGTPPGGSAPVTITVPAPDAIAISDVVGTPAGLATEITHADTGFDGFYVQMDLAGGGSLSRLVLREDAPLAGGLRSIPLLAPATVLHLEAESLVPTTVRIAIVRLEETATLFPGFSVPVMAGRMITLPSSALEPVIPGGTVIRACSSLPAELPETTPLGFYEATAVVCIPADGCTVSNDTFEDSPARPGQCFGADRALVVGYQEDGDPFATTSSSAFVFVAADVDISTGSAQLVPGVEHTMVVERVATAERYRVVVTANAMSFSFASVGVHTGPLP